MNDKTIISLELEGNDKHKEGYEGYTNLYYRQLPAPLLVSRAYFWLLCRGSLWDQGGLASTQAHPVKCVIWSTAQGQKYYHGDKTKNQWLGLYM